MIRMPGTSWQGPLPAPSEHELALADQLKADITMLAGTIGSRSLFQHKNMGLAAEHIIARLREAGFAAHEEVPVAQGAQTPNIIVEVRGTKQPDEIIIIGAHYDCYHGTPGADDNASGVAATLSLAKAFLANPAAKTIRFALFVNEEPPTFWTQDMGSWVYARQCRARGDRIIAMYSLESIGYFSDAPNSQHYPPPLNMLYPSTGNFIGFIGNYASRALVRRTVASFREHAQLPSEGAALPSMLPGVGWSDHWSFWQEGYPALMVTCTATYRNPHYHLPTDIPAIVDHQRAARVVAGLELVIRDIFADTADPAATTPGP